MSRRFFQQVVRPRLGYALQRHFDADLDAAETAFVRAMTRNPLADPGCKVMGAEKDGWVGGSVSSLTPAAFVEELARTDVGQAIVREGEQVEAVVDDLVTDFAQQFDRYGRAASEFVAARARTTSLIVGCALAFLINVDAERLISALMQDPGLRTALIEQVEEVNDQNRAALESLDAAIAQHSDGGAVDLASLKAARAEF